MKFYKRTLIILNKNILITLLNPYSSVLVNRWIVYYSLPCFQEEHVKELEYERGRVIEMEQQCQLQSQQTEQRVASLESRISEMSQVIGEHESMKEKDQATVQ